MPRDEGCQIVGPRIRPATHLLRALLDREQDRVGAQLPRQVGIFFVLTPSNVSDHGIESSDPLCCRLGLWLCLRFGAATIGAMRGVNPGSPLACWLACGLDVVLCDKESRTAFALRWRSQFIVTTINREQLTMR